MLIILDESLCSELHSLSQAEWNALGNLAVASREGLHFVLASPQLAKLLAHSSEFGPRERALFKSIGVRYVTTAAIIEDIPVRVRVTRELTSTSVTTGSQLELRLPLESFATTTSVQPTILLCENLDDCDLLTEIARLYARSINMRGVRISIDRRGGGGSTTAQLADEILRTGVRFLLCVVDSDRVCPSGALGETAGAVRRVFSYTPVLTAHLHILKARELENLLPDDFFDDEYGVNADGRSSVAFLRGLSGVGCWNARLYVDLKDGLLLGELFEADLPSGFEETWGKIPLHITQRDLPGNVRLMACANAESCFEVACCECTLIGGFGSQVLRRGITALRQHGREYWRSLPPPIESVASEAARLILAWGCASAVQSG